MSSLRAGPHHSYTGNTHLCSSITIICYVLPKRLNTTEHQTAGGRHKQGTATAAQEAWPPTPRPPHQEQKLQLRNRHLMRTFEELHSQNLCQQRHRTSYFLRSLPNLAKKKENDHRTSCANLTPASQPQESGQQSPLCTTSCHQRAAVWPPSGSRRTA